MTFDRVTFAARRRKSQEDIIAALEPIIAKALDKKREGSETWWRAVVDAAQPIFDRIVTDDGGTPAQARSEWAHLALDLANSLTKTKNVHDYSATLIATWVASNILSYATEAAAKQGDEPYLLEWISMHDSKVRHTHKDADGQRVRPGHPFRVGTSSMRRPGDVSAPIKEWINCRCTVAPVPLHDNPTASMDTDPRRTGATMKNMIQRATPTLYGESLVAALEAAPDDTLIPWHGVLCVEGVWTGDRRKFQSGSLTNRDLPLPLTWQKESQPGHDGNITVASIDWLERDDTGAWNAGGRIMPTSEADEMVGLLAHFGKFGVSIDADMAEMSFTEYDGGQGGADTDEMPGQVFSAGRICGACVVGIGAVSQAWVTLGESPDHDYGDAIAASIADLELGQVPDITIVARDVPTDERNKRGKDGSAMPDGSYPIANCSDLKNAIQAIGRAKNPQAVKSALGCPDVEIPDSWAVDGIDIDVTHPSFQTFLEGLLEEPGTDDEVRAAIHEHLEVMKRGPGWITNPEDTKRLHDYWTVPGHPGYEEIAWGTPGDFNRCRTLVGEKIAANSPSDVRFLNQICAQWHHDATGFWPGHAPTEQASGDPVPAVALVASVDTALAPTEWFTDPKLTKVTPMQMVEENGLWHYFGHVTDWTTCHMGFNQPGQCVKPEPSTNGYAYYRVGEVMTDQGPVATGCITLATGHAGGRLGMRPALAHYDNTGTAVADVACGDDEFGIWVNGWVRPWVSDEKRYELRAHPPSIDQRRNPNTGNFDLIAVLSVNAPGLPVLRYGVENGVQMSIIATLGVEEDTAVNTPAMAEIADAIAARLEERQREREEFEALVLEDA